MRYRRRFGVIGVCAHLALAVLGFAVPAPAVAQGLGPAQGYNVFVLNDQKQSNVDIQGRVAVGHNADYSAGGMTIGSSLSSSSTAPSLIVGGDLTNQNHTITGSVVVGGTANLQNPTITGSLSAGAVNFTGNGTVGGSVTYDTHYSNPHTTIQGQVTQGDVTVPIDFAAAATSLTSLSSRLSLLAPTGVTNDFYNTITFVGTGASLEVFDLTSAQLAACTGLTFGGGFAPGATVVVNVTGTTINAKNFGFNLGGVNRQDVLFNFSSALTISSQNLGWQGSILAPSATFTGTNGNIDGTLVARNLYGNIEAHDQPFTGILPHAPSVAAPEPSLGLFGFLVGGAVFSAGVRRRKQFKKQRGIA